MIVNHCGEVKGRRCGRTVNDSPIGKPVEFQNKRHARKASVSRMPSTRNQDSPNFKDYKSKSKFEVDLDFASEVKNTQCHPHQLLLSDSNSVATKPFVLQAAHHPS